MAERRSGSPVSITVVGAGPAGLWSAWQAALAGNQVTVVERAGRVGGMAASIDVADLRVDLGSHRLHPSTSPAILAKLRELLGEDLQTRPRHGRIHLAGRWLAFPLQAGDLLRQTPPSFALGSMVDAATGPLRRPQADTFAEVVRAGLGPTVYEEFYRPYVTKIWGIDPSLLSGHLARRRVSASSPTDIVRRLIRGAKPAGRTFLSPRRGFGQISEALADAAVDAGATIRLDTEVKALDPGSDVGAARLELTSTSPPPARSLSSAPDTSAQNLRRFVANTRRIAEGQVTDSSAGSSLHTVTGASLSKARGSDGESDDGLAAGASPEEVLDADLVWSTAPITELARRCSQPPGSSTLEAVDRLEHRGLVLVYLVLDQPQWTPFDAHYLPGADQLAARVSEPKNYRLSTEDPAELTVLCAEVPATVGDQTWTATDSELASRLIDDLARIALPAIAPVEVRTVRLPRVYPVYRPGFEWDLLAIEWWLAEHPRLVSFGRQGLFVPDNTHHALAMADAATGCITDAGAFDHHRWALARNQFRSHVVED